MTEHGSLVVKTDYFSELAPQEEEYFELHVTTKNAVGTWSKGNTHRKVILSAIPENELNPSKTIVNPYIRKANYTPSEKVKIGLFRLDATDSSVLSNGIVIRHFNERTSGVSLFRIDSGLPPQNLQRTNQFLESCHVHQFLSRYACSEFPSSTSDFLFSAYDIHVTAEFLSFETWVTYSCGAPHPDEENFGINFDITTGMELGHEELYLPRVLNEEDSLFETIVYAYLSQTYPDEMNPKLPESEDFSLSYECGYYRKNRWTAHCSFVLKPEGIHLLPSFSHSLSFCYGTEWSIIPYSEMHELINPEYLTRLTKMKP